MNQHVQVTGLKPGVTRYPRYDGAALGFEHYWYPVMRSRQLKPNKPVAMTLFGEKIMFYRDQGKAYALHDRCPHRGIKISIGKQEFPGTFTCRYHGWTFDLKSGTVVAALTDGPDSKVCGHTGVRTYPVEERAGFVWIYNGTDTPPPVEADIPSEFLRADAVMESRITERPGDWRHAAENGYDEGHGKYLHRFSWWVYPTVAPAWVHSTAADAGEGWIYRKRSDGAYQSEYPGLGVWPKQKASQTKRPFGHVSIRLPGVLRTKQRGGWMHFEWYVPTTVGHHRYIQVVVKNTSFLDGLKFRLQYWTYIRWLFHVAFNNEDALVVEMMETPPELLYRPDLTIIGWRKMCEGARMSGAEAADMQGAIETAVDDFSNAAAVPAQS